MDLLKKFKALLLDATVGLVKQYQSKTIDLVKLEAATYYVRGIQLLRKQVLALVTVLLSVVVMAVSMIVVPFVWLAWTPCPRGVKLCLAILLGIIDIGVPLGVLIHFLSEKKWMEFSKSDELIENVMKKD